MEQPSVIIPVMRLSIPKNIKGRSQFSICIKKNNAGFSEGAKVNDRSGLLQGDYKDGRRITIFKDMEDVISKETVANCDKGVLNSREKKRLMEQICKSL